MATESVVAAQPGRLWQALNERLAFAAYVPRPVPSALVEEATFLNHAGQIYHVLKQREQRTYLSLPPDAYALWRMMDGSKPVRQIALEYALVHMRLVTGLLRGLIEELREKGFLQDPPANVFSGLDERCRRRASSYWLRQTLSSFILWNLVQFRGGDRVLGAAYRSVGWVLFTPPLVLGMWLVLLAGSAAWAIEVARGGYSLITIGGSYVLGLAALLLLNVFAISLHELGHALAVKHKGREVISVGVLLYYGAPCAYVNTSDIWMADRRSRILVSWAGPFVTLTLAGLMGLVALTQPGTLGGDLAFKAASVWFFGGLINFIPLLELDGYFILVDLIEMPLLRARSFEFVRTELWSKLRLHERWTHEERVLAVFGVLALLFSGLMLALSAWVWNVRGAGIATELWNLPAWYGRPLMALFLLLFGGPLLLGVLRLLCGGLRWLYRRLAWQLNERRLARHAEPLLHALPYLQHLRAGERTALAEHLVARRYSAGVAVVRQGDHPDGFYFILNGEAQVERREPNGTVRRLAILDRDDYFGELAYLTGAPRNATVRARGELEVYYLDGGQFHRWLEDDLEGRDEVRSRMLDQALLAEVPIFSGLSPVERSQLFERLGIERFAPGDVVFRQGDSGTKLYIVAEGSFEVLARAAGEGQQELGRHVAELRVGEFFGEIALLRDEPRTASVRALKPAVCYTLNRKDFGRLLESAPSSRASLDQLSLERVRETRAGLGARLR
ncbi:MAG TPA: cyclic nucleotide-binding domain-containing protein [Chloroflexota bacterium]|nr:cyclic nucleotide-binding domain-containing protein [Chloroflexota bacterium]